MEHSIINNKIVYSFDVFDTVVTRITAHPRAVFLLIQEEFLRSGMLLPASMLEDFYTIRLEAERTARKQSHTEDVTIEEIYGVIKKRFDLSQECIRDLISLEISVEASAIVVIPSAARLISDLRNAGLRIIFISDMYLPRDVLEWILAEKGVFKKGDGLYVSGHIGLAKRTGNLFKKVLHHEQLHHSQMTHHGDNRRSDYARPVKQGIDSLHLERGCLSRYERLFSSSRRGKASWLQWQLFAGASRLARLRSPDNGDERLLELHGIGANIAGPILFGFVSWLFIEAEKKGLTKLYFLARDGQVLYEIAKELNRNFGNKFTLKYLYTSRQAWHLPAITEIGQREIGWITGKFPFLSLRILASRIGVEPVSLQQICSSAGLFFDDLDKPLAEAQIGCVTELFSSNGELKKLVLSNAERARLSTIAYLKQEGLFDDSRLAVVDSGLFGRSQDSLMILLNLAGWSGDILGFYFGIIDPLADEKQKYGYFFSPSHAKHFRRWGRGFMTLLELMCSADHGATLAYLDSGGRWEPVLTKRYANAERKKEIEALRSGIMDFVKVDSLPTTGYDYDEYREKSLSIMKSFYLSPTPEQAEVLGDLQFTTDQTEREFRTFAPRISIVDACRLILRSSNKSRFGITYWIHGSRVRSGFLVRNFLLIASWPFRLKNFWLDKFS